MAQYGYVAIDGISLNQKSVSPASAIVRSVSAMFGVCILATLATSQVRTSSLALSTTTSRAPVVAKAWQAESQPTIGHVQQRVQMKRQAQNEDQVTITSTSSKDFGLGLLAACSAAIGLLGFAWRRPAPVAMLATSGTRPTLADTKLAFLAASNSSIPNMYNIPLQELLAQHHLLRFNSKYQYDEVFALGIVTVIGQLLEGMAPEDSERIQGAYFKALGDDMQKFKSDAAELEAWASSSQDLGFAAASGSVPDKLKSIAARAEKGELQYSKFFSIGLFQLLQQSGRTDPETFTALVKDMSLDKERVTKDLKVYKDLLKRLEMAKDMKEKFLERERKKQAERLAQKSQAPASV